MIHELSCPAGVNKKQRGTRKSGYYLLLEPDERTGPPKVRAMATQSIVAVTRFQPTPFEDFENQTQQLDRLDADLVSQKSALTMTYELLARGGREQGNCAGVLCRTRTAADLRVFAREHPLARALGQVRLVAARLLADEAIVRYDHKNNQRHQVFPYARLVPGGPSFTETANGLRSVYLAADDGQKGVHYVPPLLRKHGVRVALPAEPNACTHYVTGHDCVVHETFAKAVKSVDKHTYKQVSDAYSTIIGQQKTKADQAKMREHLRKLLKADKQQLLDDVAAKKADLQERQAELSRLQQQQQQRSNQKQVSASGVPTAAIL